MSEWRDVAGKSTEVGLSKHQTAGDVGGKYVERPSGYATDVPYILPSKKQLELKANVLQSPTAQWASQESYEEAYRGYLQSGGTPIKQPAGVIPQSTMAARRAEVAEVERRQREMETTKSPILTAAMQKAQFDYKYILPKSTQKTQPGEVYAPRFGKMIPREEFFEKHPTPFMKAGTAFEKYETQIAKKLNLHAKAIEPLEAWYGKGVRSLGRMGLVSEPKTQRVTEEFVSGAAYGVAKKPLTTAGNIAFALLVTKGAGALIPKVPAVTAGLGAGKVARNINAVNILGAGLAAAYGFDVTGRVMSASSQARTAGEITATELIPFAAGGYLGTLKMPGFKSAGSAVQSNIAKAVKILKDPNAFDKPFSLPGLLINPKKLTYLERRAIEIGKTKAASRLSEAQKIRQLENENLLLARKSEKIATGKTKKLYLTDTSIKSEYTGKQMQALMREQGIPMQQIVVQAQAQAQKSLPLHAQAQAILGGQKLKISAQQSQVLAAYQGEAFSYPRLALVAPGTGLKPRISQGSVLSAVQKQISQAERTLGLKQKTRNIAGVAAVFAAAASASARTRQGQVTATIPKAAVKVSNFIKSVEKTQIKLRQGTSTALKMGTASVVAVSTLSRTTVSTATRMKPVMKTVQVSEFLPREIIIPLKPKSFLAKIDKYKRRKGVRKYVWDVRNPVPTLRSLLGEPEKYKKKRKRS